MSSFFSRMTGGYLEKRLVQQVEKTIARGFSSKSESTVSNQVTKNVTKDLGKGGSKVPESGQDEFYHGCSESSLKSIKEQGVIGDLYVTGSREEATTHAVKKNGTGYVVKLRGENVKTSQDQRTGATFISEKSAKEGNLRVTGWEKVEGEMGQAWDCWNLPGNFE